MKSFTSLVKDEISHIETASTECISELSAIVRNCATIKDEIKITTENAAVARRIFNLIKTLYEINAKITVRKSPNYHSKNIYILEVGTKKEIILNDLSIVENNKYLTIPKPYIVDDEQLTQAYIRGIFIATGSINDPKKSRYHLEFLVDDNNYAKWFSQLLNKLLLNSKVIKRDNKHMIYIKEAEKIGDFLRIMGAYNAILYYEDIRIYRDHKNMTNRLNNCEQANVDKIIETSCKQVKAIETIKKYASLESLKEKEKIVAQYRLKYKDASLVELSEIITAETNQPITKSGLYHRFKKINEVANKVKKNKNQ